MQKNEIGLILHHIQRWTQNGLKTNIRLETVKLLEENIVGKIFSFGNDFLNTKTQAKETTK